MSNRKQFVSYEGVNSELLSITNGVPQGSVLGPLLFLSYTNDLPSNIVNGPCFLFADNTTLLSRFDQSTDVNNLEQAKYWFLANKLSLNEEKMHHITFTSDRRVVKSDPVKLLGIVLDARLGWSSYIDYLCCKLSTQVFILRQLSGCLDIETLRIVYFSIFHSHLSYGTMLWGNSVAYNRIFVLQKKALRVITHSKYGSSCRHLSKNLKVLPLPSIYIYEAIMYIHSNQNKYLTPAGIHKYCIRNPSNLRSLYSRLTMTKNNRPDVNLYNLLVNANRGLNVPHMSKLYFSKFLKKFLLQHCFYSVGEYVNHMISVD
nr:unnamed protein product [Callosobruchus chinensis]